MKRVHILENINIIRLVIFNNSVKITFKSKFNFNLFLDMIQLVEVPRFLINTKVDSKIIFSFF